MENVWVLASVWVGLALVATLVALWFKISTALSEIVVGTVAQLVIGALFVHTELGGKTSWISFLAGTGAIVLTFLAGAELDPQIFRTKWKEATVIGLVGFVGPFLGCTAVAHYVTIKTLIFVVDSMVVFAILSFLTPRFFKKYGGRVSELEAKYWLFLLFAMGDWRSGQAAKQSCRATSSGWCWREL